MFSQASVGGDVARFTTSRIQTCLATNQVAEGCEKFVAESRELFYFLRQNLYALRVLPAHCKLVLQHVT